MSEFGVTVTMTEVATPMILSDILHNEATESYRVYCFLTPLTSGIMSYLVLSSGFSVTANPPFLIWVICSTCFSFFFLLIAFA